MWKDNKLYACYHDKPQFDGYLDDYAFLSKACLDLLRINWDNDEYIFLIQLVDKVLENFQDKDNVVVFDDCDSVLLDDLSLNLLKAALDSKRTRRICWNTDSHTLRRENVPDHFEFKGSAIFITNIKFDNVKSKKLRDHLNALESRCHYIDLTIDTMREKILRIKQIVGDGMLNEYALPEEVKQEIIQWIEGHKRRLREVSLRTVLKVADLAKSFPDNWQAMAENTILKPR